MRLTKEKAEELVANHLDAMTSLKHKSTTVISCKCLACIEANGFLEGHKAGMKAALESEAVRGIITYAFHTAYCDKATGGEMCECQYDFSIERFNQFKEAQK